MDFFQRHCLEMFFLMPMAISVFAICHENYSLPSILRNCEGKLERTDKKYQAGPFLFGDNVYSGMA